MGAEQLQGTAWHPEKVHKSCKDGSKYCLYNKNNTCACIASIYYQTECVGKGTCEEFESKGNMAKTKYKSKISGKQIIVTQNPYNSKLNKIVQR